MNPFFLSSLCCFKQWRGLVLLLVCWLILGLGAPRPLAAQSGTIPATEPVYELSETLLNNKQLNALTTGDLNDDGLLDIVVGNNGQSVFYLNNGHGGFGTATPFGYEGSTQDVRLADMDGDGDLDIVVSNRGDQSEVYLNDGQAHFLISKHFGNPDGGQQAIGDINGDGTMDVVKSSLSAEFPPQIYRNDGSGQLIFSATLPIITDTLASSDAHLVDFDGDGDLDLVARRANMLDPRILLVFYTNDGSGVFSERTLVLDSPYQRQESFVFADLDQDGHLDLVLANVTDGTEQISPRALLFYRNHGNVNGLPTYTRQFISEIDGANVIQIDDIDLDGDLDIITDAPALNTGHGESDVQGYLYQNNGSQNPQTGLLQWSALKLGPQRGLNLSTVMALADLNGDGVNELIVANGNLVYIYTKQTTPNFDPCTSLPIENEQVMLDLGGDGDLDFLYAVPDASGENATLFATVNDGNGHFLLGVPTLVPHHGQQYYGYKQPYATADLNGDGLDDLITVPLLQPVELYQQKPNGTFTLHSHLDDASLAASSIATGDIDGDGDIDLVVGKRAYGSNDEPINGRNQIYLNHGDGAFDAPVAFGLVEEDTATLALADLDKDGNLDVIVGNGGLRLPASNIYRSNQSFIYWNRGQWSAANPTYFDSTSLVAAPALTADVKVSDFNNDGFPDLAIINLGELPSIYRNNGNRTFVQQPLTMLNHTSARIIEHVFTLDLDSDGDLDLLTNGRGLALFSDGNGSFTKQSAFSELAQSTDINGGIGDMRPVFVGDLNGDGLADVLARRDSIYVTPIPNPCIALQTRHDAAPLPPPPAHIKLLQPGKTVLDGPYASPQIFATDRITFTYTLFDPTSHPANVRGFYSLDGGGNWLPAKPTATTALDSLTTLASQQPVTHTYTWDMFGSGFFGQSDQVVFRLESRPDLHPQRNGIAGPYRIPYQAAQTYPFRVRGTQVRVVDPKGAPSTDALVYRLPANTSGNAVPFAASPGTAPFRSNSQGYLSGRGALANGDQLMALAPISVTHAFTLYHSSAPASLNGLAMQRVNSGGVQTLTVSADHPLLLFNLDISLEWDARNDGAFLAELESALQRTSALLFDVSEGQMALGSLRLFQNKQNWLTSDVVIYASNSIHPRASMGGIVISATHDIGMSGIISNAYLPGQVRMGPIWDPFGEDESELNQDWQQALAHELAHYLLFLPDNYLGIENGLLKTVDCRGSFMTNTYDASYSEFLTRDGWQGDCLHSLAHHLTGRADWETILRFLPWLHPPASLPATNPGPASLPLQLLQVEQIAPSSPAPLPARNYDLRSASDGALLPIRQGQGYLYKTQGTATLEDDRLIALGATGNGSDRIKVRGAAVGDRLCLLDPLGQRGGCRGVDGLNPNIELAATPGWQPIIEVSPVSSRTLTIRVSQPLSAGVALAVQLLPAYGDSNTSVITAPWALMIADDAKNPLHFTQTITLPYPAFEGFVRVWLPDVQPAHEAVSEFFLSAAWGPNPRGGSGVNTQIWGPNPRGGSGANLRGWSANQRAAQAPIASGDGRVTIFDLDEILADKGESSLQALTLLPNLPNWLTPVGQGYRFLNSEPLTPTIAFHYLSREVPPGFEYTLNLYYSPDEGASWQRLATALDADEHLATAQMPMRPANSEGIYALMATLEMPPLVSGWNQIGYPLPSARPVVEALSSIEGSYRVVYEFLPGAQPGWQLYDAAVKRDHPDFAALVNDLHTLQLGHVYWINATTAITPYLNVTVNPAGSEVGIEAGIDLPPATYYGSLRSQSSFMPMAGMRITALRGTILCGEGTLLMQNGEFIYKLQVVSNAERSGCGEAGAVLTLFVAGQQVVEQPVWDNQFAHFQPLHIGGQGNLLYLPIIAR